jgi:excisionase family DNA binding protein
VTTNSPKQANLLTKAEVARILGVSAKTIDRRIRARELPVIRDGRIVRILLDDLEDYLRRHRKERRLLSGDGS